jgi:hypothetical protein
MADPVVIQLPNNLVVTLEVFWKEQFANGEETISRRTLEQMAHAGTLPGAFRPEGSRIWWVNKLALIQQGLSSIRDGENNHQSNDIDIKPPAGGTTRPKGERSGNGKAVPRKPVAGEEEESRPPRPLRYTEE